jgi:hypothetical protein
LVIFPTAAAVGLPAGGAFFLLMPCAAPSGVFATDWIVFASCETVPSSENSQGNQSVWPVVVAFVVAAGRRT